MIGYMKDKWIFLLAYSLLTLFSGLALHAVGLDGYSVVFILGIQVACLVGYLFIDGYRRCSYIRRLQRTLDKLDQKYLISEVMDDGGFYESKAFYQVLTVALKAMNDKLSLLEQNNREYREYVEMWVHEVKTPIASGELLVANHPGSVTASIGEELRRIDGYINQALYYARMNSAERDYIIVELPLKEVVSRVIKKNAANLIAHKVRVDMADLDYVIYSDYKWLEFILGQLLDNAVKYMDKPDKVITLRGEDKSNQICLTLTDNGMGIDEKDLPKVFEKGFTGETGRSHLRATGIGLYLCFNLCHKLGLSISIQSRKGEYTKVTVCFPKSKMALLEE